MPLDSSGVSATGYGGYARAMLGAAYNAGYTNALTGYTDWVAKSPTIDQGYLADPTWAIIPRAR